jgi:hypothetical protein
VEGLAYSQTSKQLNQDSGFAAVFRTHYALRYTSAMLDHSRRHNNVCSGRLELISWCRANLGNLIAVVMFRAVLNTEVNRIHRA